MSTPPEDDDRDERLHERHPTAGAARRDESWSESGERPRARLVLVPVGPAVAWVTLMPRQSLTWRRSDVT